MLELGDLGRQFKSILIRTLLLLLEPLVGLLLHVSHLLLERLLSTRVLVIEHLSLFLKSFLEVVLGVVELFLFLLVLGLQEGELALP